MALLLALALCMLNLSARAQSNNQSSKKCLIIEDINHKQLLLHINTLSFIKNTEYFNPLIQGHTLLGHQIHPYLSFYPATHLCIDLGVFTRRDWADTRFFSKAEPTFTFKYQNQGFAFLLGNIEGGIHHRLIVPLYEGERMLLSAPEPGLQLRYNQARTFLDSWLEWLTLLRKQDGTPEELAAGMSFDQILMQCQRVTLRLPIQVVLYHLGGQGIPIKDYSLLLGAIGGKLGVSVSEYRLLRSVCFENYYVASQYIKEVARPFRRGKAFYSTLTVKTAWIAITGSYWHGHGFSSENLGTPLYQSIAMLDKQVQHQEKIRQLFLLRLFCEFHLTDAISLGLHLLV
ncbi:MAG: hypothetical protein AAF392_02240 [Bacteroidota bacterium]